MIPVDEKFRSRRFVLAAMVMASGCLFVVMCGVALLIGQSIDGAGAVLTGLAAFAALVLGGYRYTLDKRDGSDAAG